MKSGTYFIYHGKEYMDSTKSVPKGYKILLSGNKDDLDDGFYCTESENFMKKFGFVCEKRVPKSEITEAYEIRTYAIYREKKFDVNPWYEDIQLIIGFDRITEADKIKEIKSWGFIELQYERTTTTFEKIVSIDDPDLQLIEKRTEIDINKL